MKTLKLPSGKSIPVLGQGTWRMGEDAAKRRTEIDGLSLGLDLGMNLIDTAEMYGEGGAEKVVAEAIEGRREEVFLVSKVYPHNASAKGAVEACKRSLERLKTDYLDLYLLHWPGSVALSETLAAFQTLKKEGLILDYGVSNFDLKGMQKAMSLTGGYEIATNQVMYNLVNRGIEWDLLPWSAENGLPIMSYSPIESSPRDQKGFLDRPALTGIAEQHNASAAQIAIAWLIQQGVVVIPKASDPKHIRENRAALDIVLSTDEITLLDQAFPPPQRRMPLAMR
ncbi:MAG: aldo/keto reductase [Pedobacter sp.]|uniref:aldo/keto reductase n=1 Tax=Pedobacter sp. TaxID=1411316 RepID=UPI00339345F9